jgi:CubicO group peptidase (beta-lactamase class C family)
MPEPAGQSVMIQAQRSSRVSGRHMGLLAERISRMNQRIPMRLSVPVFVLLLLMAVPDRTALADNLIFVRFEQYLESLRQQASIPGLSAAIVNDHQILWERGLGFQDPDQSVRASPDTPYHVAGLTQTFTATLLLQCIERGALTLDDQVQSFSPAEAPATVRQLLSHTSEGSPGTQFKHDEARYATLATLVEGCMQQPFRRAIASGILDRLAMLDSVPGHDLENPSSPAAALFEADILDRYRRTLLWMARPYRVDRRGRANASEFTPPGMNGATGLISTVRDLARYDMALGEDVLLLPGTRTLAWTNVAAPDGRPFPTGLGWFVQRHNGQRVIWQFGQWTDAYSSLVLKLPERNLTLILLANSDGLSAPFPLGAGDVSVSLFARIFLRLFA